MCWCLLSSCIFRQCSEEGQAGFGNGSWQWWRRGRRRRGWGGGRGNKAKTFTSKGTATFQEATEEACPIKQASCIHSFILLFLWHTYLVYVNRVPLSRRNLMLISKKEMLDLNRRKQMLLQVSSRRKVLDLPMLTAELVKRKRIRSRKLMVFMPSKFSRVIIIWIVKRAILFNTLRIFSFNLLQNPFFFSFNCFYVYEVVT